MSIYIDRKYILLLSPKLENFKQKNTNLFNFRCCFCGDSQKNKSKARGYVYAKGENYFFACHNGCQGTNLQTLIQRIDPHLAKEYILENYKEKTSFKPKTEEQKYVNTIPQFDIFDHQIELPSINSLSDDHRAKKYLIDRKIPVSGFNELFYAEDFAKFVEKMCDKKLEYTSQRVVIPFYNKQRKLIAFQGRAIDNYSMRYITFKFDESSEKLFGLHKINRKNDIFVCEGPFDSLFIPNAIATADSNLSAASNFFKKEQLVLIPDNQPRNVQIVQNIGKWINAGFRVCLFPKSIKDKDINDMVKNGGLSSEDIVKIIHDNTFHGLTAQLEYVNWKKLN